MKKTHAFCNACMQIEPVDRNWRALWISSDGGLRISPAGRGEDLAFDQPETAFACGEGSTLILVERYLQSACFLPLHEVDALNRSIAPLLRHPYNVTN